MATDPVPAAADAPQPPEAAATPVVPEASDQQTRLRGATALVVAPGDARKRMFILEQHAGQGRDPGPGRHPPLDGLQRLGERVSVTPELHRAHLLELLFFIRM